MAQWYEYLQRCTNAMFLGFDHTTWCKAKLEDCRAAKSSLLLLAHPTWLVLDDGASLPSWLAGDRYVHFL